MEVQARTCWLYRTRDLKGAAKLAMEEEPAVTRRAVLSEAKAGGDKGTLQEVGLCRTREPCAALWSDGPYGRRSMSACATSWCLCGLDHLPSLHTLALVW